MSPATPLTPLSPIAGPATTPYAQPVESVVLPKGQDVIAEPKPEVPAAPAPAETPPTGDAPTGDTGATQPAGDAIATDGMDAG